MKILAIILVFFVSITSVFGQHQSSEIHTKSYYLEKSKNSKRAAWTLLGAGTAAIAVGAVGFSENFSLDGSSVADTYGFIFIAGVVADLVSIPCFISAGNYKKMAAEISVSSQVIQKSTYHSLSSDQIPVLKLSIRL